MFEQTFKNIDDVLWKEAGCATELDYTEQTSWILFLKYLDDLEKANQQKAELAGKKCTATIDAKHRWSVWAAPKKKDGSFDHDKALTGDDLIKYVDEELFPYLKGFRSRAEGANTIEYKIGEIFSEIENKFRSGYSLRDALELVDQLSFRSQEQRHELSALYEDKLRRMGNAGRNGGEYYTPRPLIRAMIQVIKPKIGERIYDGACGSCGFPCESFVYLTKDRDKLSTKDWNTLQTRTFYAKEKKSLAYVIGIMNMILHGIEAPNVIHTNTLSENITDIQEKDRFDVVLANPPFGGKERPEVQQNFPIRTGETAFLFLQHFIKSLKAGGRAGIVIKNTFLSNSDNAAVALRKELLENCNLFTVLDMPGGTFQGAGVKTVVLFFEKGSATRTIWFYKCGPGRNLGKTNPLNDGDLKDFVALQATFKDSANSWTVDTESIDKTTYDLSVKNPNKAEEAELRDPRDIIADDGGAGCGERRDPQEYRGDAVKEGWSIKPIEEVAHSCLGKMLDKNKNRGTLKPYLRNLNVRWFGFDLSDVLEMRFEEDERERYTARKGDLLICEDGYPGRAAIWEDDAPIYFQKAIHRVRFREPERARWFLYYLYFCDADGSLRSNFTGAGIQHFTGEALRRFRVPLPPLPEQQRIVAILDEAFGGLASATANAEKNLKNARELFDSYLNSVFAFPDGRWFVCKLAECVEFVTYGFTNPMPSTESGPWMITAKNVVGGKIDYASARHTSREAFDRLLTDKSRPKIGDVLLTKDGTLGRLAVVDRAEICINQSVALLRPNGRMISHLIKYLLSSHDYQRRMIGDADGATIKHIYITRVPKMDVAFPASLDEQRDLVARLTVLSDRATELESGYLSKLDALRDLKQSILQKAFADELTAPPSQATQEAAE